MKRFLLHFCATSLAALTFYRLTGSPYIGAIAASIVGVYGALSYVDGLASTDDTTKDNP